MLQLEVAIVAPAFIYIPLWVGVSNGLFAAEDIDVSVQLAGGTTHGVTDRICDGRSQIGIGTPEGVLLDNSGQLVIVAGFANRAALSLVAQPRFTRIEDLRGASLGVASLTEGTAFILREMLARHGLLQGDYRIVEVGTHPVRWEALKAGALDAALQLVPYNFMAQDAGYSILAESVDYVPSYAFTTVNVRRDWAESNEDALTAFLRGLANATAWLYDHSADSIMLAASASGVPAQYVERAVELFVRQRVVAPDLELDASGIAAVERTLSHAGATFRQPASAIDLRWINRVTVGHTLAGDLPN